MVAGSPGPQAKPAAPEPRPAPPEDDGDGLFLQAMGGVRRLQDEPREGLKGSATPPVRTTDRRAPTPPAADCAATELFLEEIGRLKLEKKFVEALPDEDELKPLAGNRLKQVKRGVISLDRQLDLHGLTRNEALEELPRFLRNARAKACKAVLVITGKGLNSSAEPVLQQAVTGWLRDAGRELVVEFAPAPREMGGSGALVVFLRPLPKQPAGPS
jgi:DNA-nicking Smr family endonuclease